MAKGKQPQKPWFLQSSCPVELPAFDELTKPKAQFESLIAQRLAARNQHALSPASAAKRATVDGDALTLGSASTTEDIRQRTKDMRLEDAPETKDPKEVQMAAAQDPEHPLMKALSSNEDNQPQPDTETKMHTEKGASAYRSTTHALVDLFSELGFAISGPRLRQLLESAWNEDPLMTLKLIFCSRSIHLGQSSRPLFYRCAGWLAQNHPLTLVANLKWLCRPVIEKKAKKNGDADLVLVEPQPAEDDDSQYDVSNGVSHGYWKDLLNILALAVNHKLSPTENPSDILNPENDAIRSAIKEGRIKAASRLFVTRGAQARARGVGPGRGGRGGYAVSGRFQPEDNEGEQQNPEEVDVKETRRDIRQRRHKAALKALDSDPVYLSLHLAISRLFAEQLEADLKALRGDDKEAKRKISLCGKWAPSHDHFHDRHTFVVSSIAEAMHPRDSFDHILSPSDSRETYLRHAREEYRKDVSALRKHLEVVERNITANTLRQINYDRVPSIAMNNNMPLFIQGDSDRFQEYLERVAAGKADISGATLLPSQMLRAARLYTREFRPDQLSRMAPNRVIEKKVQSLKGRALGGQWKALVQRVKDSGALASCIAVCDVSGSMNHPQFEDGTCPLDSAIGLSLLLAEVAEPPFDGNLITFSSSPAPIQVDLSQPLANKYQQIWRSNWGESTDLAAVFENVLLPMAVRHRLKPEAMVRRLFVFSDMHFDAAARDAWDSATYERIRAKYRAAGYEAPEVVFWNLAGGRAGYSADPAAPNPVTAAQEGVSLVSGYSQALLKAFIQRGSLDDVAEEDEAAEVEAEETVDDEVVLTKKRKAGMDPITMMKKSVGHRAYEMLRVMD